MQHLLIQHPRCVRPRGDDRAEVEEAGSGRTQEVRCVSLHSGAVEGESKLHERVKATGTTSVHSEPESACSMRLTGKTVEMLRTRLRNARQRALSKETARPPGLWTAGVDERDPYAEPLGDASLDTSFSCVLA